MSMASRLLTWWPAFVLLLTGLATVLFILRPSVWTVPLPLLTLYALPLLAHRLLQRVHPVRPGVEKLVSSSFSPWWASHQLQWVYLAFPALETLLRAVPGLFSLWLRAWGSEVGARVYWTPHITVADRSLLVIGDQVVFGHRVAMSSHIIKPTRDGADLLCVIRPVRIEAGAFIGAGAVLGPGAVVRQGAMVEAGTIVAPGSARR